jgi:nucleoside-diphosphate-sugar epimerase
MKVLVLGGTHHVGRAIVQAALDRGDSVTTMTRGVSGPPAPGAAPLYVDRTDRSALAAAVGAGSWDAAIDTWSGAPRVVRDACALLAERVPHYVYVSSRSVYRWPIPVGSDETAPVVDADPDSDDGVDYPAAKRGGELAALEVFGERTLLARAGLILGPFERIGRLPWWLRRLERGGLVLAPGPPERALQYIDGRDLAAWLLSAAEAGVGGPFNTVSQPGHTTIGELLEVAREVTGDRAQLVWLTPDEVASAQISPWTELPIWVPPDGELAGLHSGNVAAAYRHGLRCRPVQETVNDTWRWLQAEGDPASLRTGSVGLSADREEAVLASVRRSPG